MHEQKDKSVKNLVKGIEGLFRKNGVTYISGLASFKSADSIIIANKDNTTDFLEAKKIVLATGSEPVPFRNVPFDEKQIVSSTGALHFKTVPKSLVVIGGGIIGLELGSVWSRLGSEVTVVEYQTSIGAGMDHSISSAFQKILQKQGLKFRLGAKVDSISKDGDNVLVKFKERDSDKLEEIVGQAALVAVGRRPYTEGLNLDKVGVKMDEKGRIFTKSNFQTSVENIFAIGDVIPGPMLAHKAEEEGTPTS